ncbi:hypothetical protein [Angustibacter aerolatus]|nr:hypothetical protein [Angustibacter aerolatus]
MPVAAPLRSTVPEPTEPVGPPRSRALAALAWLLVAVGLAVNALVSTLAPAGVRPFGAPFGVVALAAGVVLVRRHRAARRGHDATAGA